MIEVEVSGPVATLWLANERKRNALGKAFWDGFEAEVQALDKMTAVRVIVLKGRGGHFCAGLDLMEMAGAVGPVLQGGLARERQELYDIIREMQRPITALANTRKPVVAAIQGYCVGGGLDLVSAADIRLASRDALFSLREARIGIVADIGSLQRLGPIIGQGHLRELAFTAKDIDAERAYHMGLVNELYDDPEALEQGAAAWAEQIAECAPLAVQGTKQVLTAQTEDAISQQLRHVAAWNSAQLASKDLMTAMQAFAMKEKPEFEGR